VEVVPESAVEGSHPVDERLLDAVRTTAGGASRMVVLVGDPMQAVHAGQAVLARTADDWHRFWKPRGPGDLVDGLRGSSGPRQVAPRTVVWLEDLARFLLPVDPGLAVSAASALRAVLVDERVTPTLVLATLVPDRDDWRLLTHPPASGGAGSAAQAQALMRSAILLNVSVATRLPEPTGAPASPPEPEQEPEPDSRPDAEGGVGTASASDSGSLSVPAEATTLPPAGRPTVEPLREPGSRLLPEPGGEPLGEPGSEPLPEPGGEPLGEPGSEPLPEPGGEPLGEPGAISLAEPGDLAAPTPRTATPSPAPSLLAPAPPAAAPSPLVPALPATLPAQPPEPADAARWRAAMHEAAGNLTGAERFYESAAISGDLEALARLGRLRDLAAGEAGGERGRQAVESFVEEAVAEGNTAVLFTLAAAGHPRALAELAQLRERQAEAASEASEGPEPS
jgi:hypothetical protein